MNTTALLQWHLFRRYLHNLMAAKALSENTADIAERRAQTLIAAANAENVLELLPLLFRPQDGPRGLAIGTGTVSLQDTETLCYRLLAWRGADADNRDRFRDTGARFFPQKPIETGRQNR